MCDRKFYADMKQAYRELKRIVFVAENGLRSDFRVYNLKIFFMAGACHRSPSKCVLATHALSVPTLCPRNLLILATPLRGCPAVDGCPLNGVPLYYASGSDTVS